MEYLLLKALHILSAIVLFGTGLGSAFYKYFADRSGDVRAVAVTMRHVVLADWLFTTPAVFVQPLTGLLLLNLTGLPWTQKWVFLSLGLYILAGACWVPVVFLQISMRDLAGGCADRGVDLPPVYRRMARQWFWLGVPAFVAMTAVVFLMVFKPA